ncbi:signal peptidase II [Agrococcus versicolor]|uniref:signal peptidase II n=1 Tax=Agrococcus versicolor TaxID=501482 RepID=UPI0031D5EA0B
MVVVIAVALGIDQATKALALTQLSDGRTVPLGWGVSFELIFNPGVAFGLGAGLGLPFRLAVTAGAIALAAWVITLALRGTRTRGLPLLAVAAGGALGNVWDRLTRAEDGVLSGEVVDFIAVDSFAVFNVADVFTTTGLLGWVALLILRPAPQTTPDNADQPRPLIPESKETPR